MLRSVVVTKPAPSKALITLYEAKVGLRLTTDTSDDLIEMLIKQASDEIATICNRVLAQETVIETFRAPDMLSEIFLSRYPVTDIASVNEGGSVLVTDTDYAVEVSTGRLIRNGGAAWGDPVIVDYTGGYVCPFDVPDGLRRAALLYSREAYFQSIRGDQSVRMYGHKESRIIYFDPNQALRSLGGGAGSQLAATPAQRAIRNLLDHYTRFAI